MKAPGTRSITLFDEPPCGCQLRVTIKPLPLEARFLRYAICVGLTGSGSLRVVSANRNRVGVLLGFGAGSAACGGNVDVVMRGRARCGGAGNYERAAGRNRLRGAFNRREAFALRSIDVGNFDEIVAS